MPDSRLRSRRPMLVAVIALLVVGVGLHVRKGYYHALGQRHRAMIGKAMALPIAEWPGRNGRDRREAKLDWIDRLRAVARQYERIAIYPWLRDSADPLGALGPLGNR